MLLARGSARAPRRTANRSSRGSRGQGTTSRGVPNSSGKSKDDFIPPAGPKVMRDKSNMHHHNYRDNNSSKKRNRSSFEHTGSSSDQNSPNPYESEQLENAAKRSRRDEQNSLSDKRGDRGNRGASRGGFVNKQVRFAEPTASEKEDRSFSTSTLPGRTPFPLNHNPFLTNCSTSASSLGAAAPAMVNPFGAPSEPVAPPAKNPFGTQGNPFATHSQPPTGVFGAPSGTQPANPFLKPTTAIFGAPSNASFNPFLQGLKDTNGNASNSIASSAVTQQASRPFGAPSTTDSAANSSSSIAPSTFTQQTSTPFGTLSSTNGTSTSVFGAPNGSKSNQFTQSSTSFESFSNQGSSSATNGGSSNPITNTTPKAVFGASTISNSNRSVHPSNSFGPLGNQSSKLTTNGGTTKVTSEETSSGVFGGSGSLKPSPFGQLSMTPVSLGSQSFGPSTNASARKIITNGTSSAPTSIKSSGSPETSASLALKIEKVLSREGIRPPCWPSVDAKQNFDAWETYTKDYRDFRNKMRVSLTRAGLIDDPDVPKRLEDAIVFKGTCETMCPELEMAERIVERRFDQLEKDYLGNGSFSAAANYRRMVKKLARSAAGQEAPLPNEVRTVKALKKTLDYLIDDILGEMELALAHGFIWDRTRAIRRDFVFHTYLTPEELVDRIYVLENIARFHVVALHQMSKQGISAGDFVEQQEHEQLGKTLVSLIHAYEDCAARQVECENEAEFRAYYLLFNRRDPGILKRAQDWGWKFWGESEDVQIAASLVEAYQNTWDTHGPLDNPATKGNTQFDITQCGFSKFFSIVEDRSVSYIMACFAEISFNDIRKSIMKTILKAYRRQKDQTKDWTLSKLNAYLRFDDEANILIWGEKHGLHFESGDDQEYLSFEQSSVRDPWPEARQQHSYTLVERKRGDHSLPEVIHATVYDTSEAHRYNFDSEEDDEGLFVKDDTAIATAIYMPTAIHEDIPEEVPQEVAPESSNAPVSYSAPSIFKGTSSSTADSNPKQTSTLDRLGTPKTFGNGFFNLAATVSSTPKKDPRSIFIQPSGKEATSIFTEPAKKLPATQVQPLFSFLSQPSSAPTPLGDVPNPTPSTESPKVPITFGQQPDLNQHVTNIQSLGQPQPETETQAPAPQPSLLPAATQPAPVQNPLFSSTPQTPRASTTNMPAASAVANIPAAQPSLFSTPKPPPSPGKPPKILGVAKWVSLGDGGLLDQFTEFHVEKLLRETGEMFMQEQQQRTDQEAEAQARVEADQFRYWSLVTRYGQRWREAGRRLGLKRRGREARQARKEMAESMRASKAAQKAALVEDFKASTTAAQRDSRERRGSLESLVDRTGVLDGAHDSEEKIRAIVQQEIRAVMQMDQSGSSNKRPRSQQSSNSMASSNRHKRGRSDNPHGRSLLSDPTYLNGGSRIHLMSNYDDQDERRRQISGVQTDYFRLKARGITTLHDGSPLANSAAKNIVHQKRSFDGITKPVAPPRSKVQVWEQSVPAKPVPEFRERLPSVDYEDNLESMKVGADALLPNGKKSQQRRVLADDDEALFARAKRIREQMDEGAEWFRKQILKKKSRSSS